MQKQSLTKKKMYLLYNKTLPGVWPPLKMYQTLANVPIAPPLNTALYSRYYIII